MKPIFFKQTQLYRFLNYCNKSNLDKSVLDCGAGGMCPPLALFSEYGYRTYGIEISDSQREKALNFSQEYALELNISAGDMCVLPFEDEAISFIYSYNSIFHMKKKDIEKAIGEIKRVLKPQGILCVNFLSIDDEGYGMGKQLEENEFLQLERGEQVIHSYYAVNEAERYFKDMEILLKETRILNTMQNEKIIKQGYIDYIVQKKE